MLKTPIVFIIFKRPETTQLVFDKIRQVQPAQLLVIADGPRADRAGEAEQCAATRAILKQVDWDCEVLTNFSETNLGCKYRIATGLDWAFEQVEAAIILEDDCVPDLTFFQFCAEMLERYRDDTRIMAISGDNFLFGRYPSEYSYYFSQYWDVWGWATWRRAWQYFDVDLKLWEQVKQQNLLRNILPDARSRRYWHKTLQAVVDGQIDTWDYQWSLAIWLQHGLCIHAKTCLVTNVGFGGDATNTSDPHSIWAKLPIQPLEFPLQHPPFVIRDAQGDRYTQKTAFELGYRQRMKTKLKKLISSFVH
jgi:hypothetical protein